jgi:hypothetical protein
MASSMVPSARDLRQQLDLLHSKRDKKRRWELVANAFIKWHADGLTISRDPWILEWREGLHTRWRDYKKCVIRPPPPAVATTNQTTNQTVNQTVNQTTSLLRTAILTILTILYTRVTRVTSLGSTTPTF